MSSLRSNAQPATSPGALRHDDERRRDEARLTALQNQVDELRQAMREVLSRQGREEELFKHYESATAQNRIAIEQLRQESQQSAQARALDENRTRQQVNDLDARLEDVTRPIRSLQAHVMELIEAARLKADDTAQYRQRDEELQTQIEHLSAHVDRTGVLIHQVRDVIDSAREETDELRRDIVRAEDSIKIVDQDSRRRVAEVTQEGATITARIDELRSDLGHLFDRMYRAEEAERRHIQGTGLGLTIVKAIVDAHEAAIEVESEHGKGTTFRVTLPRRAAPPAPPSDRRAHEGRAARGAAATEGAAKRG